MSEAAAGLPLPRIHRQIRTRNVATPWVPQVEQDSGDTAAGETPNSKVWAMSPHNTVLPTAPVT